MKIIGRIAYWLVAVVILAAILVSLDYSLDQAVLIGLIFCPCALALEYWMPKAVKPMDKVYLSLAVLSSAILLILFLHMMMGAGLFQGSILMRGRQVAPMLINPAFLGLILTSLSFGDFFWAKWLTNRYKDNDRTVTFFSDRRSVTLKQSDIAYIESNDTEVRIVTVSGESFRNKTGISQWENLLGDDFLRIHRSFIVNVSLTELEDSDTVSIGDTRLPVSRKYKESVAFTLRSVG